MFFFEKNHRSWKETTHNCQKTKCALYYSYLPLHSTLKKKQVFKMLCIIAKAKET